MDLKESKFDLEQAASEVYEKAEQIYKGSEINQDTLTGVLHRFFKDTFTARQLQALEDYFEEQEKIFYDMYGGDEDLQENKKITEDIQKVDVKEGIKLVKKYYPEATDEQARKIVNTWNNDNSAINPEEEFAFPTIEEWLQVSERNGFTVEDMFIESKITEAVENTIPGLENYENIADSFDNYKAYEANFGPLVIVKVNKIYYIFKTTAQNSNDFIQYTTSKDYVNGWLYGAVQCKNRLLENKKVEEVNKQRIPTSELPDFCYSYNDTTGEIIVIKKGVEGYYPSNITLDNTLSGDERKQQAEELIKEQNEILGVTDDQRLQMELNSMFGWDKTESKLNEVLEISGEDVSIDSIFHFPNVIAAMQETCREAIMELNSEDKTSVTEKDIRVIYNELSKMEDIVNKYLEKANPDEDITESKKVTEGYVIGLSTKTVKELAEDEVYDKYVQDINDGPVGTLNITTTDNIEDALQIEEKFDAYTLADEIKERYPEWNSVVAFFK